MQHKAAMASIQVVFRARQKLLPVRDGMASCIHALWRLLLAPRLPAAAAAVPSCRLLPPWATTMADALGPWHAAVAAAAAAAAATTAPISGPSVPAASCLVGRYHFPFGSLWGLSCPPCCSFSRRALRLPCGPCSALRCTATRNRDRNRATPFL
ncbi:hypothetical protein CDD81_306 [Ophiocordyceps australis]|uniref:Uncharacterized protein n=1 Tax=Ophiocordyceps australis TaxID=1399860 RepID=A0A2C5XW72_9HYPO|nr:hypothetical protein CDD81_306 [Ophiocordyceps australis]